MLEEGCLAVPTGGRHRRPDRVPATRLGPALAPAAASVTGRPIAGRYLIESGSGDATGAFDAYDERLRRPVRIAFVNLDSDSAELVWGGIGPAADARLSHPALMALLDTGHDERSGCSFLVTERPGPHRLGLAEAVHSGLDPRTTSDAVARLADLLAHLHAAGLGHAELSEHSVWLGRDPAHASGPRVDLIGVYAQSSDAGQASDARAQDVFDLGVLMTRTFHAFALHPSPGDDFPYPDRALRGWNALTSSMLAADPPDRPTAAQVRETLGMSDDATADRTGGRAPGRGRFPLGRRR